MIVYNYDDFKNTIISKLTKDKIISNQKPVGKKKDLILDEKRDC